MADRAHNRTDKKIDSIRSSLRPVYRSARIDVRRAFRECEKSVEEEANSLLADVRNAKTKDERKIAIAKYKKFFSDLTKKDELFVDAMNAAAERLYFANKESAKIINASTADIYADNYNYIGRKLGRELVGYDFKPVSESDAALYGEIERQKINKRKDVAWNRKNIIQSILISAGLLIAVKKIFDRTAKVVTEKNENSSRRQAGDMATGAENKGRIDSMYRVGDEGFEIKKVWIATLDNLTRDSHIEYDGMPPVGLDYEYNTGLKFPKDKACPFPEEVKNCRCSIAYDTGKSASRTRAARWGTVHGPSKVFESFLGTYTISVENMSYEEWMKWRQTL